MFLLIIVILVVLAFLAIHYYSTLHVPTLDLANKHVVITGASEGLGCALSVKLAEKGAHVTMISRSQEKLAQAVKLVNSKKADSSKVLSFSADVADYNGLKAAIDKSVEAHNGKLDVLICCAGFCHPGRVGEIEHEWFAKHIDVNYMGHVNAVLAALPYMKAQGSGRIVGVLSVLSMNALPGYAPYCAAKYAARGFYESLSWDLLPYNIHVSIGIPGTILSPGYENENKTKPPETLEAENDSPKLTPEQIADKFINDIVHWKAYISPSGLDTDASVSMCAGLSLVSFKEAIMQTLGASVLRFAVLLVHITKVRAAIYKHVKVQKKTQ